jgi:hypothetical protein
MGQHLLANPHIAKFNEQTESYVSLLTFNTIEETAVAMLKRPGSCGITIIRSQKKFIFHNSVLLIFPLLADTMLQNRTKELSAWRTSPRYLELRPHVRICFS